jgi:hypothetical protein
MQGTKSLARLRDCASGGSVGASGVGHMSRECTSLNGMALSCHPIHFVQGKPRTVRCVACSHMGRFRMSRHTRYIGGYQTCSEAFYALDRKNWTAYVMQRIEDPINADWSANRPVSTVIAYRSGSLTFSIVMPP